MFGQPGVANFPHQVPHFHGQWTADSPYGIPTIISQNSEPRMCGQTGSKRVKKHRHAGFINRLKCESTFVKMHCPKPFGNLHRKYNLKWPVASY